MKIFYFLYAEQQMLDLFNIPLSNHRIENSIRVTEYTIRNMKNIYCILSCD